MQLLLTRVLITLVGIQTLFHCCFVPALDISPAGRYRSTTATALYATSMNNDAATLEAQTLQLSAMEADRDEKRREIESTFAQIQALQNKMKSLENELQKLDSDIDTIEQDIMGGNSTQVFATAVKKELDGSSQEFAIEITDSTVTPAKVSPSIQSQIHPSEMIPDPCTQIDTDAVVRGSRPSSAQQPATPLKSLTLSVNSRRRTSSSSSVTNKRRVTPSLGDESPRYPWSSTVQDYLSSVFNIESFRDYQEGIINETLDGNDVFVIMRTGGGKSLTYQLPALLESLDKNQRKVTFVISPLLSLIQDQVDQMNAFWSNSALSFTSEMAGGATEHARRWAQVRDPNGGICLVFVTPEKVHKSNKLRSELQKLHNQGRLGRFVIDEAHCACQWGHDFRPDYAQLGILKSQFPTIPTLAVTATASDRVREDVCKILKLRPDFKFFRSSANRPNLNYSVRTKCDGKDWIIQDMAELIKEKYPRGAGIVYTFSRSDADNVADKLCEYGIVSHAYHSNVASGTKEMIHKSWMSNDTQVVVATIAFGLGINKPDVRFVMHHTISKSIEAYYQESGRAGRDGLAADCVLYYSPRDVPRMMKMIQGSAGENMFWPMVQYGQASGNDAVCKAIILASLGEPNSPDPLTVQQENDNITNEPRDVGSHAKTVTQLLHERCQSGDMLTLNMLVKEWRIKPDNAAQCVKDNSPAKGGLSVDDCERVIISLLLENIISYQIVWNTYDSVVYLKVGQLGASLLRSVNPKIVIRFPKKSSTTTTSSVTKKANARKSIPSTDSWHTAKRPKSTTKATKAKTTTSKATTAKATTAKAKTTTAKKKSTTKSAASSKKQKLDENPFFSDEENEFMGYNDDDDNAHFSVGSESE